MSEFIEQWLEIHSSRLRIKTGPQYRQLAHDYVVPALGNLLLRNLHLEHIETQYQSLLNNGVSVRTVRYVHALLHRCLNDALKRGYMSANPAYGATLPLCWLLKPSVEKLVEKR